MKGMDVSAPYTPEVCSELEETLTEADTAAAGDAKIKARIEFLRTAIRFTRLQYLSHHIIEGHEDDKPLAPDQQQALMKMQQEKWLLMRRIVREQPLAINVASVAWGGEGAFRRFGFKGAASVSKGAIEADENGRPVERTK